MTTFKTGQRHVLGLSIKIWNDCDHPLLPLVTEIPSNAVIVVVVIDDDVFERMGASFMLTRMPDTERCLQAENADEALRFFGNKAL